MSWSGASDCPVCLQTVSGATGPYSSKLATLGFLRPRSAIIHWTVRCATRLSSAPAEQWLLAQRSTATDPCKRYGARTVRAEVRAVVRGAPDSKQYLSGAASDCPVPLEDKAPTIDVLLTLTVGWRGGAPDCPVRPSLAAFPNAYKMVGGYIYHPNRPLQSVGTQATFQAI
jgi:hypothetical protein